MMNKNKKTIIIEKLIKANPDAKCSLDFKTPFGYKILMKNLKLNEK